MFILDTNVLSAMMSLQPSPEVTAWVDGQPEELLFTTSISHAEILSGLAIMDEGRLRRDLEAAATAIFTDEFEGRVPPRHAY
jgi:predicted nucleic acid-binding protein